MKLSKSACPSTIHSICPDLSIFILQLYIYNETSGKSLKTGPDLVLYNFLISTGFLKLNFAPVCVAVCPITERHTNVGELHVEKIQDSCNFSVGHILFKHISPLVYPALSVLPALTLSCSTESSPTYSHLPSSWPQRLLLARLPCCVSPLPVQEGRAPFFAQLVLHHRSPNPSVPLMGTISDSSATFPSSSLRTSLHP